MTEDTPARIGAIDTVRGVAVMGILLMNIVAFSMPEPAYTNPRAFGGASGADLAVYLVNFVLFDGRMRGLFSFLFGASTLLVLERAEAAGRDPLVAHYARMGWLLAFGLAHLWLVWWGDILSHYALVGMIAFGFRDQRPAQMIGLGVMLIFCELALTGSIVGTLHAAQVAAAGPHPDPEAVKAIATFQQSFGVPSPEWIAKDLALHRGSYAGLVAERFQRHLADPLSTLIFVGCETLAYMLFGMAALKSGLLTGQWPRRDYARWCAIGFGIGIPGYALLAWWVTSQNFSLFAVALGVVTLTALLRPPMILGWACLIMLVMRPGGALTARVAAAGRMAFTNYLGTSLICTTIFYGYGLGWYGWLGRAQLYWLVPGIWALMLLWSKPWLVHFRYGPLEWLWRSLVRGRLQAIRGPATDA